MPNKIAVIILNWNGLSDTLECISSFKKNTFRNFEIIVADNGSSDGSLETIRQKHTDVTLIDNKANLGFAGGNNTAMEYALQSDFDFILLANNDTTVNGDYLEKLVSAYKQLPEGSILGSQIRFYDNPDLIWHFGAKWNNKKYRLEKIGQGDKGEKWDAVLEVDQIVGCAMFIPKNTLLDVGLLEAKYFLNYEETDWCFRAKKAGFRFFSIPDAIMLHKISRSFTSQSHNTYFCSRNRLLWLSRNFDRKTRWHIYFTQDIPKFIKYFFRLSTRLISLPILKLISEQAYRKSLIKSVDYLAHYAGVFDYLRGRFGNCPEYIFKLSRLTKSR